MLAGFKTLIIFGLLALSRADFDYDEQGSGSGEDVTATTASTELGTTPTVVGTTPTDTPNPNDGGSTQPPAPGSTPEPVVTGEPGSTVSQEPVTTGTPVTSETGGSTATPIDQGTTTTTLGFTGSTLPPTTILPNVSVNYNQFSIVKCDDQTCTYQFDTPKNNQHVLATENSIIEMDRLEFSNLTIESQNVDGDLLGAYDNAAKKIQELQAMLNHIQSELEEINGAIIEIQANQSATTKNLYFLQQFVTLLTNNPDQCLYARCLKPTPPPRTTTTPPPPPTTTPSPCVGFSCPNDVDNQFCATDDSNRPYCTNCAGNLDGYQHCDGVTCDPNGSGFAFPDGATADYFSNGYNATSPDGSTIPAGSNCVYNLIGNGFSVSNINLKCLNGDTTLTVITDDFTTALKSAMTDRTVKNVFKSANNPKLVFTAAKNQGGFCQLTLQPLTSSSKMVPEPKKRGFFGWLMGY